MGSLWVLMAHFSFVDGHSVLSSLEGRFLFCIASKHHGTNPQYGCYLFSACLWQLFQWHINGINGIINGIFSLFRSPCKDDIVWKQLQFTTHFYFWNKPPNKEPTIGATINGKKPCFCSIWIIHDWLVFFLPSSQSCFLYLFNLSNWAFERCTFPFRICILHSCRHSYKGLPPWCSKAFLSLAERVHFLSLFSNDKCFLTCFIIILTRLTSFAMIPIKLISPSHLPTVIEDERALSGPFQKVCLHSAKHWFWVKDSWACLTYSQPQGWKKASLYHIQMF